MVKRCSSHSASSVSWILRARLRSGRQEQVLGELLGDRAAALDDMAGAQIGRPRRARARSDRRRNGCRSGDPRSRSPPSAGRATFPSGSAAARTGRRRSPIRLPSAARIVTLGRRSARVELAGIGQGQREIAEDAADDDQPPQENKSKQAENAPRHDRRMGAERRARRNVLRSGAAPRTRSPRWTRNGSRTTCSPARCL